jgi:hypothetical protein
MIAPKEKRLAEASLCKDLVLLTGIELVTY